MSKREALLEAIHAIRRYVGEFMGADRDKHQSFEMQVAALAKSSLERLLALEATPAPAEWGCGGVAPPSDILILVGLPVLKVAVGSLRHLPLPKNRSDAYGLIHDALLFTQDVKLPGWKIELLQEAMNVASAVYASGEDISDADVDYVQERLEEAEFELAPQPRNECDQ